LNEQKRNSEQYPQKVAASGHPPKMPSYAKSFMTASTLPKSRESMDAPELKSMGG
jgi:hypothetical protein